MAETALIIAGVEIPRDSHGRLSLNALHKASRTNDNKRPSQWTRLESTQELIAELHTQSADLSFEVVKGGSNPGIYAHELLAVSYAGWISPAFQLTVNRVFLASREQAPARLPTLYDPAYQMLMQAVIDLDTTRHEVAMIRAEQEQHTLAIVEQQRQTIEALHLAAQAEGKANLAIANQLWSTVREYVYLNKLQSQMPTSFQKEYGLYLTDYCQRHGVPVRKIGIADRAYGEENGYLVEQIAQTLEPWLRRRQGQGTLVVLPQRETTS